jgi:hypothetical protein
MHPRFHNIPFFLKFTLQKKLFTPLHNFTTIFQYSTERYSTSQTFTQRMAGDRPALEKRQNTADRPHKAILDARILARDGASLRRLVEDYEAVGLVAGLPLTMAGEEGPQARAVRVLAGLVCGGDHVFCPLFADQFGLGWFAFGHRVPV